MSRWDALRTKKARENCERRIAKLREKETKLSEKIGQLMAQRADVEEALGVELHWLARLKEEECPMRRYSDEEIGRMLVNPSLWRDELRDAAKQRGMQAHTGTPPVDVLAFLQRLFQRKREDEL
jgi:hypothetical protein